ncbi:carboxymuconolactone decarboxylase family protein [Bradyrhizobium sp.]|uniref:carboxymuconolactone decarboxylase family protein n=1 Tax=Bradyrhizobium sp. TaxID=376 RepID=UPI003C449890
MKLQSPNLGGRLPLQDPDSLGKDARQLYDRINSTMVPWASSVHFQSKTGDGRLIGPFNPPLFSPEIASRFLDLQEAEQRATTLSDRVRQVVILTVGAVWNAPYELYAHTAAARHAGIPEDVIRTLAAGGLPDSLSPAERIAQCYARQLSAGHRVDAALYTEAERCFSAQGVVDMTFLIGIYHVVCALLNGFEIPSPDQQAVPQHEAKLTLVASFPRGYFLENLAVRADHSVLVTVANKQELWYVPPTTSGLPVAASLLYKFGEVTMAVLETEPDVFHILTGNGYTTHESYLHRLDLRGWSPGATVHPEMVMQFPDAARAPNGASLIAPGIMLVADCFASLIWRVDLPAEGGKPVSRVWLRHHSMGYFPGQMKPEQPGVNGVRYAPRSNTLYYTATAKKLFMRVAVNPDTHEPAGEPELVLAGRMGDDFCIDEDANVAYLTTHRQNTIDRVSLDPAENSGFTDSIVGDPFTDQLIGPSSAAWGRAPGDYGRVAYVTTDGGTASPLPGGPRPATLLRVTLPKS